MNQTKAFVSRQIHPKWQNSLPFRVGLLQTLVATMLLVATLLIMLGTLKEERLQQELNLNLSQGQLMLAKLHDLTSQLDTLAVAIADVAGNQSKATHVIEQTIPSLLSLPEHRDMISSGGIWPEPEHPLGNETQARSLFWVRDLLGQLRKNEGYNNTGRGYLDEDWYKPVRLFPAGRVFWSPSYVDPHTQEPMVTASVPIWQDHEFRGVATIDVSLTSLTQLVNQTSHEMGGYVMLLDQFNQILSFPVTAAWGDNPANPLSSSLTGLGGRYPQFLPLEKIIDKADQQFINESQANLIITQQQFSALAPSGLPEYKKMYEAIINNGASGESGSPELLGTLALDTDPVLREPSLMSVYLMPDTFWKVITVTPKTSFRHEAFLLAERAGLYLLLAQLIALGLMFAIQQRLFIRPLARMVSALKSDDAAYLELEAAGRKDEVGVLASAFVARTRQLEIAMASLDASNLALEQQLEVQREAQQDLLTHREHLLALLKSSPNLIYIKDISGRYLLVNDKFCETIGLDRNRILGTTDHQIFSSDLAQSYADSDKRVVQQDSPLQYEEVLPTRLGELRFQMTKFAIRDDEDNLRGIGAIAFDIQSRKRLENELLARVSTLEAQHEQALKEHMRLETQLRHTEFSLSQQSSEAHRSDERDRAWHTERRLVKAWYRDLLTLIAHEQDTLLSRACSSDIKDLDQLRDALSEQAERLRLLDVISGKHKGSQHSCPLEVLQALSTLFKGELESRNIELHIEGERKLFTTLEAWQITLLSLALMRLLISLGDGAQHSAQIRITTVRDKGSCIIRFDRQGVSPASVTKELDEIDHWLKAQFGAELLQLSPLAVATLLDCHLPLASD